MDDEKGGSPARWRQVLEAYELLEPGERDTWTPVQNAFELSYRLCLFYALAQALERAHARVGSLTVLDVGCSNGRTTRMYVDLGLAPEQLVGVDLRAGAIDLARKLHPTIRFVHQEGEAIPFPDHRFSWVSLIGVVSSIRDPAGRQYLFDQAHQKLRSGGHLFYFDLCRAPDFAGRGRIGPVRHVSEFQVVWRKRFRSFGFVPAGENWRHLLAELRSRDRHWAARLRGRMSQLLRPSHEALLLRK